MAKIKGQGSRVKGQGKVLVTGAAGFVGSNLTGALLKKGYKVIGLDNLSQGCKRNIKPFLRNGDFKFVKGDVRTAAAVRTAIKGADFVAHLAAYKIPRYGNAMDTLMVNSLGTKNVLDGAVKCGAKVVFTSTSDVYGKSPEVPFREDGDIVLGHSRVKRWAYASSKLFDEHLCFAYEEKHGLKAAVLRLFGSYGPNQNLTWWGGPQSVFIGSAMRNEPIEIHGDGLQTRSFSYVDDTVNGIVRAIESPKSSGELFNIGNDEEITILDLAKLVWSLVRGEASKPKFKFIPYKNFSSNYQDVRRRVPSLEKARKMLGYVPKISLEEGLIRTIEWQRRIA